MAEAAGAAGDAVGSQPRRCFKIFQYNAWMEHKSFRSTLNFGISVAKVFTGSNPTPSNFPAAELRTEMIPVAMAEGGILDDADVLSFSELWDEAAQAHFDGVFRKSGFAYSAGTTFDGDHNRKLSRSQRIGHGIGRYQKHLGNVIWSRHPINKVKVFAFTREQAEQAFRQEGETDAAFQARFRAEVGGDPSTNLFGDPGEAMEKFGFVYARLKLFGDGPQCFVHVVSAHLYWPGSAVGRRIRAQEMRILHHYLRMCMRGRSAAERVFLVGDLNVDSLTSPGYAHERLDELKAADDAALVAHDTARPSTFPAAFEDYLKCRFSEAPSGAAGNTVAAAAPETTVREYASICEILKDLRPQDVFAAIPHEKLKDLRSRAGALADAPRIGRVLDVNEETFGRRPVFSWSQVDSEWWRQHFQKYRRKSNSAEPLPDDWVTLFVNGELPLQWWRELTQKYGTADLLSQLDHILPLTVAQEGVSNGEVASHATSVEGVSYTIGLRSADPRFVMDGWIDASVLTAGKALRSKCLVSLSDHNPVYGEFLI